MSGNQKVNMMSNGLLIVLAVQLACLTLVGAEEEGHCVWYGQCGEEYWTGNSLNCVYNGTAKPLMEDSAQELLEEMCPHLLNPVDGELK